MSDEEFYEASVKCPQPGCDWVERYEGLDQRDVVSRWSRALAEHQHADHPDAALALLLRVIDEVKDPWFTEAYEGFNDGCVFCGSQDRQGQVYWHLPACLWFDIHAHLGLTVGPEHRQR